MSATLNGLILAFSSVLILVAGTYLFTSIRFEVSRQNFTSSAQQINKNVTPPQLPYAIPWLGNSPSFLSTVPHRFWKNLFARYPRAAGAISIVLGGNKTIVVFNVPSTQYILQDRKMGREVFNEQVVMQGLGLSQSEADKFYEHKKALSAPHKGETRAQDLAYVEQEKMNLEYLLKADRVNELTGQFAKTLQYDIANEFLDGPGQVNMYSWLRRLMFTASTTSLMGSKILEVIPDLEQHFFTFDADMLSLFFGLPKFLIPKKYANRDVSLDQLMRWYTTVEEEIGTQIPDPNTIPWEPYYGSRITRARHVFYRKKGLSPKSKAGLDLGMLFGISSNAIPATGWLLTHIINSTRPENKKANEPTLYEYILAEVKEAQNADGSLNIPILTNQPILLSAMHEVLRLYVDTLISRKVPKDMTIPMSSTKAHAGSPDTTKDSNTPIRSLFVKAGSLLMLPTYPAHSDPTAWSSSAFPHHPAPDVYYPYRFLTASPKATSDDKPTFTTSHTVGKYFPFGGGKTICPGRSFARQEILAAVAMTLLTFDFEFVSFVDNKGCSTEKFPGLRDTLPGSAVMVASGDVKVKVRRRRDVNGDEAKMVTSGVEQSAFV